MLCDEKHNPVSVLHITVAMIGKKIGVQMKWDDRFKKKYGVRLFHKIRNQKKLLEGKNCEDIVLNYLKDILPR